MLSAHETTARSASLWAGRAGQLGMDDPGIEEIRERCLQLRQPMME
jgi:hypothetical protein